MMSFRTAKTRADLGIATLAIALAVGPARGEPEAAGGARFSVAAFGAAGDGIAKETAALQRAVDAAHQAGGGTVYFPPGTYLTGSVHLRSRVALLLDHGATIKASPDDADFDPYEELDFENDSDHETSFFHFSLLWGEGIERAAILGTGTIDGNRTKRGGPKPIALKRCREIAIRDVTIVNAPNYAISMLGTDHVNIDGVSILNGYCDGIDPDCCRHVRIANCHIETWDDAIVPKASFSLGEVRATESITVINCQLASNCNAFKLGTESRGDFKHITVSNCVLFDRGTGRPPTSGISIESVDGAHIDGVAISNIAMRNARVPIFLRLGNRGRDMAEPVPGSLRNVVISNVVATGAERACPVSGIAGAMIQDVTLANIQIDFRGGGTGEQAAIDVPEREDAYPEATMFGELPAYGFFVRHAAGVRLRGIRLGWESPDLRPAIAAEDVAALEIDGLGTDVAPGAAAVLRFHDVRGARLTGSVPAAGATTFLLALGARTAGIHLIGNVLDPATAPFAATAEVVPGAVLAH